MTARRQSSLDEIVATITADGGSATGIPCDVTDAAACGAVAERVASEFGALDILVNSAFRMGKSVPFASAQLDKWDDVFATNVRGTLNMTQAMLPLLQVSGDGRIVMIGSMSGRQVRVAEGAYAASKAALATLTRTLALELGGSGG